MSHSQRREKIEKQEESLPACIGSSSSDFCVLWPSVAIF